MRKAVRPALICALLASSLASCSPAPRNGDTRSGRTFSDYGPAPNFQLPSVEGGTFELAAQAAAHRAVILTFVAADCKEECPKVEAVLRSAAQRLAQRGVLGRSVEIATVELDPGTNTAAIVRSLRRKVWPREGWAFLRGSPAQTRTVLKAYDVYVESRQAGKDVVHSTYVYVIDDRMRQIDVLGPHVNLTPRIVVADAEAALQHRPPPGATANSLRGT